VWPSASRRILRQVRHAVGGVRQCASTEPPEHSDRHSLDPAVAFRRTAERIDPAEKEKIEIGARRELPELMRGAEAEKWIGMASAARKADRRSEQQQCAREGAPDKKAEPRCVHERDRTEIAESEDDLRHMRMPIRALFNTTGRANFH
jgi:hypothetical protein